MLSSLAGQLALFAGAAVVIGLVGTRLTALADRLADRTGLGEALFGALFLGAVTSLPGITASVTAALHARPELALTNALGGIAAQTAFLAVGDMFYRRVNLEHAAASLGNLLSSTLLMLLLAMLLLALLGPEVSLLGVHPVSYALPCVYLAGLRMVATARAQPMWLPRMTGQTRTDVPEEIPADPKHTGLQLWLPFAGYSALIVLAGWTLTRAAEELGPSLGLSDSVVGAMLTGVFTSLPELVTCIAAIRRGALTLAVGGIIGGNAFDTLFAASADVAYTRGSIYHATGAGPTWLLALGLMMTAVLLLGLLWRQQRGPANIGVESIILLLSYSGGMAVLVTLT